MTLTSALILLALSVLIRELRNGFYALHLFVVVGLSWLVQQQFSGITLFSPIAIAIFLIFHLVSINLVTFLSYFYDKRAAQKQGWRIAERSLHALALIGGTPGAFIAQKKLRHKTKKQSFRVFFWMILVLQIIAILALIIVSREQLFSYF